MTSGGTATMAPNRIPPYKVTKPTPPHKVAKPTPRTHEENQERAYIAASRRSDRSLEARMESAKRASEIHKKRTGRYYRITEETVINEQMYEEEDDTPRFRLANHMHLPNTLLQQRAQAMMSIQMENRKLLGQAVNSTLQHNPQFQNQAQFINPGFMSMSPGGYNFLMPSPQMNDGLQSPMSYQHSPYPTPGEQKPQNFHQRSASVADFPRQHSQSAQSSPVDTHRFDNRRMSLPQHNSVQQSPRISIPQRTSPVMSRNGSYPTTPSGQQQASTPLYQPASQSQWDSASMGPLTTALPRDTQQLLDSGIWPNMNSANWNTMAQNPISFSQKQQPFYNYRPNSSGKPSKPQSTTAGLDQTLLATAPETNGDSKDSSNDKSAVSENDTADSHTDGGFDFALEDDTNMFGFNNMDTFNPFSSQNSAQATPHFNDEWTSFLDNDMFGEMQGGGA